MPRTSTLFFALIALALLQVGEAAAQAIPAPDPRPSQTLIARTALDDGTYVKITYSSPQRRGREVFGELVPYGRVWRTGANEATELTTTGDITLGGHVIPAGTYSLFTIPGEEQWTVIVDKTVNQWGAFRYDEATDLLRFDVMPTMLEQPYEAFTIAIEDAEDGKQVTMAWDDVKITLPLAAH